MMRIATTLLCTFLFAGVVSATPPAAPPVPEPTVTSVSPVQPLLLPGTLCSAPVEAATFSPRANYCGECAVNSHCTLICDGPGTCAPADYNPRCGVCICS